MDFTLSLSDTLVKGLQLYANDNYENIDELSGNDLLQAAIEQIVTTSLESFIRVKSQEISQEKTVDELADTLDV